MAETITRKCAQCKSCIVINRNNIDGVVYHKGKYYHSGCFEELCRGKVANKRNLPSWQQALDNIWVLESEAKEKLNYQFTKDELNEWLLTHYDVVAIPNRFWTIVEELKNGTYNKKKCKPIDIKILLGAWKWGQKNLNDINRRNKINHKGPSNDTQRLNYDLAILLGHMNDYMKYLSRTKAEDAERNSRKKETTKINYNSIEHHTKTTASELDDISGLLDDIF